MANLLEIKDLSVSAEEKEILKGVSLELKDNETHVLMGPNGAGKSTLGSTIMGSPEYTVTNGKIFFDGEDITELSADKRAKKGIFLSFQNPIEIPGITLSQFLRNAHEQVTGKHTKLWDFKKQLKAAMEVLDMAKLWTEEYIGDQDGFLESMAAAAQAVVDYFQQKEGIIYINVMNNMSIDCDCVNHPAPVKLEDYGILASTDPVALDQACVDIINNQEVTATNDPTDLLNRIDKQHGVHTIEHAEAIGLGSRRYTIVNIDK